MARGLQRMRRMKTALLVILTSTMAYADDEPSPDWATVSQHAKPFVPNHEYGDAHSGEAGASVGMMLMGKLSGNISPQIGWFLTDHVELSAILSLSHVVDGGRSATYGSALFEPSLHLPTPWNPDIQAFAGLGFGVNELKDVGFGLAFAPRLGVNIPVGDHGVFTPSLSLEFMTHGVDNAIMATPDKNDPNAPTALRLNIGYTSTWF